jgi:hypothetical protein
MRERGGGQGAKPWDTVRDLRRVWDDPRVRGAGFGPANTLMVEAEPRKVRDWRGNAVVIDEYTGGQVGAWRALLPRVRLAWPGRADGRPADQRLGARGDSGTGAG